MRHSIHLESVDNAALLMRGMHVLGCAGKRPVVSSPHDAFRDFNEGMSGARRRVVSAC
jgi:hypothetical protein